MCKVKTSVKVIATGNGYEVVQKAGVTADYYYILDTVIDAIVYSAGGDKVEIMRIFKNLQ